MQIFEKKHHYYNILSESAKLKRIIESDTSNVEILEKRNMNYLYNSAFVGILMEKVPCEKVKGTSGDLIRIELDNETFDCPDIVLKKLLKEDYKKFIKFEKTEVDTSKLNEKQEVVDAEEVIDVVAEAEVNVQGEAKENMKADTPDILKKPEVKVTIENKNEEIKEEDIEEIQIIIKKPIVVEPEIKESEQLQKNKNQLVLDYYKLTIKGQESAFIDEIDMEIIPIDTPLGNKKVAAADIMVYVRAEGKSMTYVSEIKGRKSISINTGNHEFIVRGSWDNGNFKSFVYPAGQTLALKYDVVQDLKEVRPTELDKENSGHVVFYTENNKISIAPLNLNNDIDSLSHVVMCYEHDNIRTIYTTEDTKILTIDSLSGVIQVCCYWERDLFICDKSVSSTNNPGEKNN